MQNIEIILICQKILFEERKSILNSLNLCHICCFKCVSTHFDTVCRKNYNILFIERKKNAQKVWS